MEQEEILRKEAVRLHSLGKSINEISDQLNRTRQWVHKWIRRYQKSTSSEWERSQSFAPKHLPNKTDVNLEQLVIKIRKNLSEQIYAQKGAVSILYEFEKVGIKPPSLSSINRILRRNKLIEVSAVKRRKSSGYPDYFQNVQQMDLVGPRYLKGGFRFYLYNIIDIDNHFAGVYPIPDKSAESIVTCLIDFWSTYQMPDFLQMDNELSFRGSNRHPRGLGLLMRLALSNGVTPLFIPQGEPWRNGIVEKFNDNAQEHFLDKQTFTTLDEMKTKAKEFSVFHNENHRYSSQGNRTPDSMVKQLFRKFTLEKSIDLTQKIMVDEGRLILVRFIRSDLKLHVLNEVFIMKPNLQYSYVIAEVVLVRFVLVVHRDNVVYHVFPFIMSLP